MNPDFITHSHILTVSQPTFTAGFDSETPPEAGGIAQGLFWSWAGARPSGAGELGNSLRRRTSLSACRGTDDENGWDELNDEIPSPNPWAIA